MKIVFTHRLPLAYVKTLCTINARAWDYGSSGLTRIQYWARIVLGLTDKISRRHNALYLVCDNDTCIGYLMAYSAHRPRALHPVLWVIHLIARLILLCTQEGREELASKAMYDDQAEKMVQIGKYILAGKNHRKVSEGIMVAVHPEYRQSGVYRELTGLLMDDIQGCFIFHTSTESVYQAHEALGYTRIFEAPLFYPEQHTVFIMSGKPAREITALTSPSMLMECKETSIKQIYAEAKVSVF
jgi:hypothetical protein